MVQFSPDEIDRIQRAELILLGIQPSEVDNMDSMERGDVLEIAAAQARLRQRKMNSLKRKR